MPQNKKGSPDARKIVANLVFRYRSAQRCRKKNRHFNQFLYDREIEAWNAYVASKKILLGLDP